MVKLVCVSWIPRSYIHLFETYAGLEKISLNISEVKFEDDLSFKIANYKNYPEIHFTQEWSGLHYFIADFQNENVSETVIQFIRDMQLLLLNEIFKKCHTVTFTQISRDIIPLDFHVIVLSKEKFYVKKDFVEKKVNGITVVFNPNEIYSPGTMSYVFGSEDLKLNGVLLYHAYVEITASFLMNMMKRMIRLYHEADNTVKSVESFDDLKSVKDYMDVLDRITKDCSESFGKLKQTKDNFNNKLQEYLNKNFSKIVRDIADGLEIEKSLKKISMDSEYMLVQWEDVLVEYLKNIDSTLDARLMLHNLQKKKGLFG